VTVDFGRSDVARLAAQLGIEMPDRVLCSPDRRREALPPWLTPAFVATEPARQKLAAWIAAGKPDAPTADAVLTGSTLFGDELANHTAARIVAELPPPMANYITTRCTVVTLGQSMLGCCSPPLPTSRPWTLLVSAAPHAFAGILVHEAAHGWLMPEPAPGTAAPSAFASSTLRDAMPPSDLAVSVRAMRQQSERDEAQAQALVEALGFVDPSHAASGLNARDDA
jgi:hypothetical protein